MDVENLDTQIGDILEKVQKETSGLLGFILFTVDGFPIKSTLAHKPENAISEQELFSAIGAGLISLAERALKQINLMPMDKLTIESPNGNIIVERINRDVGIMALAQPSTPLGMVRIAVKKAKELLESIL